MVAPKGSKLHSQVGEAETTVLLTGPRHLIQASFAYRKGELKHKDVEQVLASLPRILPKKD